MGEQRQSFFAGVMGELSRRKVLKTVGAYAVGVFVALQLIDALGEALRLPAWLPTVLVIALILGFPLVFILAWQFDVTGEGIKRTGAASLLSQGQTFSLFAVMLGLTGALGLGFYQYYAGLFEEGGVPVQLADSAARSFSAPENSIAILPFTDLSAERDQGYLSDGMAEEILNLLAQVDGLHVAARTSSFAFRDGQTGIQEIGRALNVRTVLEGSLRMAGNRVRLTAQLINVEDGYQIWSQTFEEEMDDVFSVQDDVALAIAGQLVDSFEGLAQEAPAARSTNLGAYEAYREGRQHWWRRTPDELTTAIQYFAEALRLDSDYAPAYAAMADSYILLALYGSANQMRAIERAQPMIEKALGLDPQSAEAFAALGLARMQIGQMSSAETALRQAIRLNEAYVPARLWLSNVLATEGRLDEQSEVLSEAMAVDPLNELLAINYAGNLGNRGDYRGAADVLSSQLMFKQDSTTLLRSDASLALNNGDLVRGFKQARKAFELEPNSPAAFGAMASAWFALGEIDKAAETLQEGLDAAGDNAELMGQHFQVLLVQGRLEEAKSVITDIFGQQVEGLPENFQRQFHFLNALAHFVEQDMEIALREFELSIKPESASAFDGDQIFSLTAAAFIHDLLGDAERGEMHIDRAERALELARENGMQTADLDYNEALVKLLRDEDIPGAIESLRSAYNKGWRQMWVLELDLRLAPLYDNPEFIELREAIEGDLQRARAEVEQLVLSMR